MGKAGVDKAKEYLNKMYLAIGDKLVSPDSIYSGKEGHLRLAREMGCALSDFTEQGRDEILKSSYSSIYVRGTNLKPILDAKEWINEMLKGYNKVLDFRENRGF